MREREAKLEKYIRSKCKRKKGDRSRKKQLGNKRPTDAVYREIKQLRDLNSSFRIISLNRNIS